MPVWIGSDIVSLGLVVFIIIDWLVKDTKLTVVISVHTTCDVDVARLHLFHTTSAVQSWETLSPTISNTSITAFTALTPNALLIPGPLCKG